MKAVKNFFKTMFLNFLIFIVVIGALVAVADFRLFMQLVGPLLQAMIAFGLVFCVAFVAIKKRLPFFK